MSSSQEAPVEQTENGDYDNASDTLLGQSWKVLEPEDPQTPLKRPNASSDSCSSPLSHNSESKSSDSGMAAGKHFQIVL